MQQEPIDGNAVFEIDVLPRTANPSYKLMARDDKQLRGWLVAIVIVHLVVALWHGRAHAQIPVPLTPLQAAFVGIVILLLPLVAVGMLWTKWMRGAALLIAGAMFASLVFGLVNHFAMDSPDNVMAVPEHAWRHAFVLSAALVAVTEAVGTVLGIIAAVRWRQGV